MDVFSKSVNGEVLTYQCCQEKTKFYLAKMYGKEDIKCICPKCVASGKAAEKFNGRFIQHEDIDKVDNL